MEAILKTVEHVATRNELRTQCAGSGRDLIRVISQRADSASASTGMAIESMMQAHFDNGLSENTLAGFNAFYLEYDRFNRSLPTHQRLSEGVMSEKLAHTVRRISELAGTLLDAKITMSRATGQLAPTVTAIRDVLSELEA
eukprot:1288519-Pleurochrysis_carterae.AAC.1